MPSVNNKHGADPDGVPNVDYIRRLCEEYADRRLTSCEESPERRMLLDVAAAQLEDMRTDTLIRLLPVFGKYADKGAVPDIPLALRMKTVEPPEPA